MSEEPLAEAAVVDVPAALADSFDRSMRELEGVEPRPAGGVGGAIEYLRAGRVFAALGGGTASYRLGRAVVRAALRTPDTKPSARGADWVEFAPVVLDQFALDRATAWFESAWRHALD